MFNKTVSPTRRYVALGQVVKLTEKGQFESTGEYRFFRFTLPTFHYRWVLGGEIPNDSFLANWYFYNAYYFKNGAKMTSEDRTIYIANGTNIVFEQCVATEVLENMKFIDL